MLYRDDPNWVPPLRANQKELLGFKYHPFYDQARICNFVALRNGLPCGRIAAIDNQAHNRAHPDDRRGFIGFFECIDDQQVANQLFDSARQWLRERGLVDVRGPTNPSLNYECGLLVQNFSMPPTFLMTYNPPYYQRLWEEYGFVKAQDLYSFSGHRDQLRMMEKKIFFVVQEATRRFDIRVRKMDTSRFAGEVRTFLALYNDSMEGNWGHVPMSTAEILHVSRNLRHLIVPQLAQVAEINGRPVGAVLGLLDYNPRIKQIDGRLYPFGFLKIVRNRRQIRRIRIVAANVVPEYQRWGLGLVLAAHLLPPALEWGIEEGEFSWVLESNQLSRKSLERGNVSLEKIHRIYDCFGSSN